MKRTLGGDRLGSGKRMKVELKAYERSTHDLGYIWRSTMAAGTLVPFLSKPMLPGDTFDIDLDTVVLTHPTIGPLFGSFKVQLDVFFCPVRLYQGKLHNNSLRIGMDMSKVKLPTLIMQAANITPDLPPDNQQINPSSIYAYLGIRGLGKNTEGEGEVQREFNAVPLIAYWDIYKNYYANKQEGIGAVINNNREIINPTVERVALVNMTTNMETNVPILNEGVLDLPTYNTELRVYRDAGDPWPVAEQIMIITEYGPKLAVELWDTWRPIASGNYIRFYNKKAGNERIYAWRYVAGQDAVNTPPNVLTFDLDNLDEMREDILAWTKQASAFQINSTSIAPYGSGLQRTERYWNKMGSQEGLALKTYQSDKHNNWLETEWIDGENGINNISRVDTSDGFFNIDALNLAKKVYDMLNRIAASGGSYDDWMDVTYDHERYTRAESPVYMGGLSKELIFEEVISNADASANGQEQPLGTLAGRGKLNGKHKGGKLTVKADEIGQVIGIVSLTPRIDYSQGNEFDVNLKTMNDYHKPGLDQIGFQDVVTDQMATWDTDIVGGQASFKSAGKQPAWTDYMTAVNQVYGNFAIESDQMFMTLTRRYETDEETGNIKDLTTYIDPQKFNHIFAQTSRDSQNFWVQIKCDITARRKMSAKTMPNL